jgi:hypothetical protein
MTAAAVMAQARAAGVELLVHDGKLASCGATSPDLRAAIRQNKDALLVLLQRPAEPTPAERRLIAVVEQYAGWWPLSVPTICRVLVAQKHPMASGTVGLFPEQAVDLR